MGAKMGRLLSCRGTYRPKYFVKLTFLLLLPLLVTARPSGPPTLRVTFSPLTQAAYAKASCVVTKPRVTFPLKKVHSRLVIPTAKGQKVFTDINIDDAAIRRGHGEDESVIHTYLGYLPAFHCHLIQVQSYETAQWLLLSDSGQLIALWGEPVFAPDGLHIASSCMGIEYGGGQPNIIQLLKLDKGVLREVWSVTPTQWEPSQLCWVSNNALTVKKIMWTGKSIGNTFSYAKLLIY
jgi:hypothetical protein